jgi:hypothetical protein
MKHYKAPWCPFLVIVSTLLTALCLGLAFAEFRQGGAESWKGWLPVALVVGCAFFTIRGYTITPDAILVHRLVWDTRLPLAGLQSARFERSPGWWGIRIGNGGFFSLTGYRYVPGVGFYRVFATDHTRRVVLRYPNRTVVVTPSAPEDFIRDLAIAKP